MPTIGAATNTANVVINQRKTKCCIGRSYVDFWFRQLRARNCLRIVGCAVNGLKSSTPSICAEKEQNCPKQKSSASRSRRVTCRNENQKNADCSWDIDHAKNLRTRSQERCDWTKKKRLNASRIRARSGADG